MQTSFEERYTLDAMNAKYHDGVYRAALLQDEDATHRALDRILRPDEAAQAVMRLMKSDVSGEDALHSALLDVALRAAVRKYTRRELVTMLSLLSRMLDYIDLKIQLCENVCVPFERFTGVWAEEHPGEDRILPHEYGIQPLEI